MSNGTDELEPVKITATIPRRLADALGRAHDDEVKNKRESLSSRGFSTEAVSDTDRDVGDKVVSLAVDANRSRRPVRRALRELRDMRKGD